MPAREPGGCRLKKGVKGMYEWKLNNEGRVNQQLRMCRWIGTNHHIHRGQETKRAG